METRAHFVIVGLFTILGIVGGLGFFLWLASVQVDRQYTRYGVVFENVTGLNQSAAVLFNGINVGSVMGIRIWENDPSQAYVSVEIDATVPIAVDTVARLESSGVTGVAYIALSGGAPGAALLTPEADGVPIIASRQTSFQTLMSDAPDLLEDAATIIAHLQELTGPQNQDHVRSILQNIDDATAGLDQALTDFSEISDTLLAATAQVTGFVEGFEGVGPATQSTLAAADKSFAAITETFENANTAIDTLGPTIDQAHDAIAAINTLVTEDVSPLADDLRTTLGSADQAFTRADEVMATDLGPALADARDALNDLAEAAAAITTDVPGIMTDLRSGVAEARAAIAAITPGMRDFGQLGAEARTVVRSFNDLLRQIAQDPSGFFLDNRVPEYRR